MVAEAQRVRERMLNDLARRRKAFRQQIERLQAGRDRLMSAYDVVRETLDVATEELTVALPQARLAAEAAALRAADEHEPTLDELEREAAQLPEVETEVEVPVASEAPAPDAEEAETSAPTASEPDEDAGSPPSSSADETPTPDASPDLHDDRPRAPSDASVEGRHSSSVKVIRADESAESAEPEPQATTEPNAEAPPPPPETGGGTAQEPAAPAAAESDIPEEDRPPPPEPTEVSSLFARIREETVVDETVLVDGDAGTIEVVETVEEIELVEEVLVDEAELAELAELASLAANAAPAEEPAAAEPEPLDPDHELIARRDEALVEIERNLGRRIKRELSDEQNELLDTVRRQKGVPTADAALPAEAEHLARYRTAALPSLVAAATAGGDLLADTGIELGPTGAKAGAKAGELAGQLAADLVEPLRQRLGRCFEETAGDSDELAERLRGLLPGVEGPAGRRAGVAPGAGRGQPRAGRPPPGRDPGPLGGRRR